MASRLGHVNLICWQHLSTRAPCLFSETSLKTRPPFPSLFSRHPPRISAKRIICPLHRRLFALTLSPRSSSVGSISFCAISNCRRLGQCAVRKPVFAPRQHTAKHVEGIRQPVSHHTSNAPPYRMQCVHMRIISCQLMGTKRAPTITNVLKHTYSTASIESVPSSCAGCCHLGAVISVARTTNPPRTSIMNVTRGRTNLVERGGRWGDRV